MIPALLMTLAIQSGFCQQDHCTTGIAPAAGLVIKINPDQMFSDGLARSWNCIDENFENHRIRSRPLAKVNFSITPLPCLTGAAVFIEANGSSVGETVTKARSTEIHSDSLTKFEIKQHLNVNFDGVLPDAPNITVNAQQSFNRAKSKNPLGGILASTAFKKYPAKIKEKADVFARQQVYKQLNQTLESFNTTLRNQLTQLQHNRPFIASRDWHLSSDEKSIYLAAGFGEYLHPIIHSPRALELYFHQQLATAWFNERFAGQTVTAEQFQSWSQNSKLIQNNTSSDDVKSWSITFLQRAADIKFKDNNLDIRLGFANFRYDDRYLPSIAVRFIYKIRPSSKHTGKNFQGDWSLVRSGDLEIRGETAGARQQILRSILRQRVNSVLPDEIPIQFPNTNQVRGLDDVSLRLESVSADHSVLNFSFDAN